MRYIPLRVKSRVVTGTGKASFIRFEGAAEMSAGQAQGGESAFGVDEKRGNLWNGCARASGY